MIEGLESDINFRQGKEPTQWLMLQDLLILLTISYVMAMFMYVSLQHLLNLNLLVIIRHEHWQYQELINLDFNQEINRNLDNSVPKIEIQINCYTQLYEFESTLKRYKMNIMYLLKDLLRGWQNYLFKYDNFRFQEESFQFFNNQQIQNTRNWIQINNNKGKGNIDQDKKIRKQNIYLHFWITGNENNIFKQYSRSYQFINKCRKFDSKVISGDNPLTSVQRAREFGIILNGKPVLLLDYIESEQQFPSVEIRVFQDNLNDRYPIKIEQLF